MKFKENDAVRFIKKNSGISSPEKIAVGKIKRRGGLFMSKLSLNANSEPATITLDDLLQIIEHAKTPAPQQPRCAIWSKKAFLRWREAGACNFTDEQIDTAGERGGFICDDRGIKLYLDTVVELDKLTLKNNLFS